MQKRPERLAKDGVNGYKTAQTAPSPARKIGDACPRPRSPGRAHRRRIPKDEDMSEFEGVLPALAQALTDRGYTALTPVQQAMLAPELTESDALVSAQTGSGKTVAFGLALAPTLLAGADRFDKAGAPLALAVAPTRELALQVKRELEWLYAPTGARVASCVGGMDMRGERRALGDGAHMVVGTPGRLRDHLERGSFDPSALRAVVLDEADEMLDLGFRDDLEYILDAAPSERRTLMFSATVPRSIATLAKRYQRDAVRVTTQAEQTQHGDIDYRAYAVAPNDRENAIINLLRYHDAANAIVFCATRATVNHMTARFNNRGFSVVALSGELTQNERSHALQAMRDGRARVCIATDVAARGIDLPNLELVIHADLPRNGEALLHRSGRTGRAGRKGTSALIVPHNWRKRADRLLGFAKIDATWAKPPSLDDIAQRDRQRIIEDPALSEPASEEEKTFAAELLTRHGAEQVAAAYVRLLSTAKPAAEELIDTTPPSPREHARDDFTGGVWFSVSVGHKHNAEPRWLLPMLCRAGHITKRDIGAIRIQQAETFVEIAPGAVDTFVDAIGPGGKVEKTVTVTRLDGVPDAPKDGAKKPYGKKPHAKKKPYTKGKTDNRADGKPHGKPGGHRKGDKPGAKKKVWESSAKADKQAKKGGKPFKAKTGKTGGKASGKAASKPGPKKRTPTTGGTAPMKRKTLRIKAGG